MANSHSFPLLRLPLLPIIKGIQLMNVREQFKLSKVSKRSRCTVRSSVKKQCYQLELEFRESFPVTIKNLVATNEYRFNLPPADGYPDVESIKKLIVQVAAVFSDLAIDLDGYQAPHPRYLMDLVLFSKSLNLKLAFIYVSSYTPDDELCKFIFQECNNFQRVALFCNTSSDFEIIPEQIPAFHSDQFVIHDPWFTMNHVLQSFMNCKKLELSLSFSVTELNAFFQSWIQGSGVHVLRCEIAGDIDMEGILNGITALPKPEVMISFDGYGTNRYSECFIIEQSNGTKGVVGVYRNNSFFLSTVFELENGEKYGSFKKHYL
ncbi:unnamed protein product [Caenorhabditis brenneri]